MGDLSDYARTRDTAASGEPSAIEHPGSVGKPVFVVHRHDASTLHFDLRLEVGGVLASWAVPKGPSVDPREKRLAVKVEDHPLDYARFEGRIDEGYGEGTVIVWDTGSFENVTADGDDPVGMRQALRTGHVTVVLHGHKLTGAFTLQHAKVGGEDENWLLIKVDDEGADRRRNPTSTQNESVLSGKTNEDFAARG